ncbi:MAG: Cell division protein DamX [Sodalis sp. Fse]|nr:MAG: Cell division protein DamX [Sodalis sp. Fse]
MDKFKSENELRPDSSDHHLPRQRKGTIVPKVPVSKQHLILGIGILVLLVISLCSVLKSPSDFPRLSHDKSRNINLSASYGDSYNNASPRRTTVPSEANCTNNDDFSPQKLHSPIPTKVSPITSPKNQKHVDLPSNITDSQSQHREKINSTPRMNDEDQILMLQTAPDRYYTLQLSSASQPETLNAYARKQQLSQYWVYETRRDGKPWYVLINGVYPSLSQAKNAITQLPAEVQVKKPWAKQLKQVKKDQSK